MFVISDLHWRCDTPSWRKETDYSAQVLRPQLGWLLDQGEVVCVAGDVFHRSADFEAVFDLFTFLKQRHALLYATRGQHDQLYHNDSMVRTGFNLLAHGGVLTVLSKFPQYLNNGLMVSGQGWGEDIPKRAADALIAHVPVSYAGADYKGAELAQVFRAKAAAFKYVFTGDNHRRFQTGNDLYNAGCFHRMTLDLADQPPIAWHVTHDGVKMAEIPCTTPMVDECYAARQDKGKAKAAGLEFVRALSEARQQGGGGAFLDALRKAETEAEGGIKLLLGGVVKICEEVCK